MGTSTSIANMPEESRMPSRGSVTWQDVAERDGEVPGQEANEHVKAPPANPFTMPNDEEIFLLRDQERERKKSEREARQNQKIWEKGTWTTRISVPRRKLLEDAEGVDGSKAKMKSRGAAGDMAAGGRRREKENLAEFISKKRDMFLVQMSLDTKKAEIKKLEEAAKKREEMLDRSEKML